MSKQHAPATARNREPILERLRAALPPTGSVLEIASGTGEHAVHFASALPGVTWQPSDPSAAARASVAAHVAEADLPNLCQPMAIDVTVEGWRAGLSAVDAIVCINMIHIAPWSACEGLFRGAAELLAPGAPLVLYGPYRIAGEPLAPSNVAFDASLRSRDPAWGIRSLEDVSRLAEERGFVREALHPMPANNHLVVFRRG